MNRNVINMDIYIKKIEEIKEKLKKLDNCDYETIEEAEKSTMEYDVLLNNIVDLIPMLMAQENMSSLNKDVVFKYTVKLLTNYLGSADSFEIFEKYFQNFFIENVITKQQLEFFLENLDLGRWG